MTEIDKAFSSYKRAEYRQVLAYCRSALEALEEAGAKRMKATEVADRIRNAKAATLNERFRVFQFSTHMITHLGVHFGTPDHEVSRADAQLVLVATAHLIRVANARLIPHPEPPTSEDES
jgi:hypothetical protein